MKKLLLILGSVVASLASYASVAYAQISTSTAGGLIDTTITDGGTLLSATLLKVFGFAMGLAVIIFVFWFILSRVRRPR